MAASTRLGGCWMGTSGRGTMGPSGDWAKVAAARAEDRNAKSKGSPGRLRVMRATPLFGRRRRRQDFLRYLSVLNSNAKRPVDVAWTGRDSYNGSSAPPEASACPQHARN